MITATATSSNAGFAGFFETSEFSNAIGTETISGRIYEDVNGDSSLSGDSGRTGVTVRLFRDGGDGLANGTDDTFVTFATTNATGDYTFSGLTNGTYWVAVDSKTITPTAGTGTPGAVWADQTYGVADAIGSSGFLGAAGANYGGRSATVSDNAGALPANLATSEHVTRVVVAGADKTNIDSGFSFNVVDNVRGDGADFDGANARKSQGSLSSSS